MRILKKIGFNDELLNNIINSAKKNKSDITKEVNRLCKIGLNLEESEKESYDLQKELKDIKRICIYTNELLKQMFANLDLTNVDINKSKSLNEYIKGRKNDFFQK